MSLVTSRELFTNSAIPVAVDSVRERRRIQHNLHRHEYVEMLFVNRGTLVNRFVSSEVAMKTGDLLVLKPYVRHVLEIRDERRPLMAYCCSFLPEIVDSSIRSLHDAARSHPGNRHLFEPFLALAEQGVSAVRLGIAPAHRGQLSQRFEELKALSGKPTASAAARTRCRFLDLLAFLADHHHAADGREGMIQAGSAISSARCRPRLQQTLNHIHSHSEQPLTLRDMAAMCGTSATYFCQLFKHETGMTFLQYLTDLRIRNACALLRETGDSVSEICYRVGFNEYSHFSRMFKKHTGVSAARYRSRGA